MRTVTEPPDDLDDDPAPARLLADLDRWAGAACAGCAAPLCGHQVLFSVALGLRDAPRCLPCLAHGLARDPASLRAQLADYVSARACYRRAWDEAGRREFTHPADRPPCLWPATEASPPIRPRAAADDMAGPAEGWVTTAVWDAGDMACGDLVLALRGRMNGLAPGAVLRVTARDPAAPQDLPAWCRLTGHRLLASTHPDYLIRRKEV